MAKRSAILAAICAVTVGATGALGAASLYSVGVLDSTSSSTALSEIRALSADGSYAVGTSKAVGGINVPVVWSLSSGLVALPNPSGANTFAHGVAVGIGSNAGNILISGLHENNTVHRYYKAPLNNLASGSWADSGAAGGFPTSDLRQGTANDLRNGLDIADGRWYTGARRSGGRAARLRGDPFVGWDGASVSSVGSVSSYGIIVGRSSGAPSNAFFEGPAQTFTTVPGSGGARTDGHGISSRFGSGALTNEWITGQTQSYNGVGTTMQAFRWNRADAALTPLGSLSPAGGGNAGNNSSTAYSIADNGVTAGRSFFDALGTEPSYSIATVWDTSGTWDSSGAPKSVQALLNAAGVNTSAWTRLDLTYAVSDDGRTLAGYGTWAADGSRRGWVATIPEPATLALIAFGAIPLLGRRRR